MNYRNPRNDKEGTEGVVSNLLITGIPKTAYNTPIYSKLFVKYTTPDGTTVEESGGTKVRIISEVANEIKKDSYASDSDKAYADAILEAVKPLQ